MRPLYIFDLDGTLALIDHRRPILDDLKDPERWNKFYAACPFDAPNGPVIDVMRRIWFSEADVMIWSGRSEDVRRQTVQWVYKCTNIPAHDIESILRMRPSKDCTPDEVLKLAWLNSLDSIDRARLAAVFDDRDKVVKMWRENGVVCFQVTQGDF